MLFKNDAGSSTILKELPEGNYPSALSVLCRVCCKYPLLAEEQNISFLNIPFFPAVFFAMDDTIRDSQVLKQKLISDHEESITRLTSTFLQAPSFFATQTRYEDHDTKPQRPLVSLNELSPIHCRSLAPNTVHHGRVLRGVIVAPPFVINAAQIIIEDEAGGFANISFYNFAPNGLNPIQRTQTANNMFPKGKKVAIIEPYYKLAKDGTLIVRVENFAEDVFFPRQLGPQCSEGWREAGKVHFTNQQFSEAIFSYKRSIETHYESKPAAILLSNIATCLLLKELYGPSLLLAIASFVVDGSLFRPFYTAGFCLNNLKHKDLVFNCLEQCRMLNAPERSYRQLQEMLRHTRTNHIPASEWNAKVLSLMASEHVHDLLQCDSNDAVDSKLFKEKGNELFKKQRYNEAILKYCTALRGISEVATLLTNRSICYAKIGKHAEAAIHASAAILIAPKNAKAHYWKSLSLLQLNHKEEAVTTCDIALEIVAEKSDLIALKERVNCALKASSVNRPNMEARGRTHLREQGKMTERKKVEEQRKHNMSTADVARLNNMFEFMGLQGAVDDRVEPFHLEFSRNDEWPVESDTHLGMELLTRAYENARASDRLHQMNLESLSPADMALLCKRVNSIEEHVLSWWFTAPSGSLSPRKRNSYASSMHHSFTNSPCRTNVLLFGTVHVSVGFVDLSGLLFSGVMSSEGQKGPLRWIGYEASAYSVAKSMVIAHMMRRQADTDCILQVWFSSSWSKKTLGSFRKALNDLITWARGTHATAYSTEVVSLWHHWQQFDVTLRTARSHWLSRHNSSNHVEIANFRRKMDRLALCRYLVSGEILESEVGSVVMFGLPSTKDGDEYEIALNEWFLHCLPIHHIMKRVDTETNFIDAAVYILRKHVSELKELVSSGAVVIEIHHKTVKLSEGFVIREIRKLSAHSISWSNLCDYCSNEEFHKMALACSGTDTTHYLSSLNWSTEIKGTFLMDYTDIQEELLKTAKETISIWYRLTGLINYLHAPPITHHYNIASYFLCQMMKEEWTENFFKAAGLENVETQAVIESVNFDVLARSQNTINMVYTFNKGKQLNGYDV